MRNLKYGTHEMNMAQILCLQDRNRFMDLENRLAVVKGEGDRGGKDWEFGISRCKLLHTGWRKNKVLLYNAGSYIHYPVINHNGKAFFKKRIYVYNGVTLLCSRDWHNIVNQLYFDKKNT